MISRNEEKSVKKVIQNIRQYISKAEIIIVDSSEDKTAQIAKKCGAKVIRQYPPQGYGPAMLKGLFSAKGEIIVTLDCDNTYPAEKISELVSYIHKGYDVVGTSRISLGKPEFMPWKNYIGNKLLNLLASVVYFKKIKDIHTGMRAYRRKVIHSIKWGSSGYSLSFLHKIKSGLRGNALPVELLLKPINKGYNFKEIPIIYSERLGKSKLEEFNSVIWTILRIINSRMTK